MNRTTGKIWKKAVALGMIGVLLFMPDMKNMQVTGERGIMVANAAIKDSGSCGETTKDKVKWKLYSDGRLVISGTGAIKNCSEDKVKKTLWKSKSVKQIIIEKGITSIGTEAFSGCENVKTVTLPDSLKTIGKESFIACTSLEKIVLPDSVTYIGEDAFTYCTGLKEINIPASVRKIERDVFGDCYFLRKIYVPNTVPLYKVVNEENGIFKDCINAAIYITLTKESTEIPKSMLSQCKSIQDIIIPEGITSIGDGAFYECENVRSIQMPDTVTKIGESAFYGCINLTELTLPSTVTKIGEGAFMACERLSKIEIPLGVTEIEPALFSECTNLYKIVLPLSVTEIKSAAFCNCTSLKEIVIPNQTSEISWDSFENCSSLQKVVLPDKLSDIDEGIFESCKALNEIVWRNKTYSSFKVFYNEFSEYLENKEGSDVYEPQISSAPIDNNTENDSSEQIDTTDEQYPKVTPIPHPADQVKKGIKWENAVKMLNLTRPEERFNGMNTAYKKYIKGAFSSKYYDSKYNDNFMKERSDDQKYGNVYRLYNYIPLRKKIETQFGIENVYGSKGLGAGYQASTLCLVLGNNKTMKNALTKEENRTYLANLAVENKITTTKDTSAAEAALFAYYGIFNNDLSNTSYTYKYNHTMTREEFYVIFQKYAGGWSYLDYAKGEKYGFVENSFFSFHKSAKEIKRINKLLKKYAKSKTYEYLYYAAKYGFPVGVTQCTYKQMTKGKITKLEAVCAMGYCYKTKNTKSVLTNSNIKKVIKKYHISNKPETYLKKAKKINNQNTRAKNVLKKAKQLDYYELQCIAQADSLGIIKPTGKKINWYAPVTEQEAIRLITQSAINGKGYLDIDSFVLSS